ncbi:putative integral membrane protein (TIGR00698 family) [Mucilaginibacter yixingensis]|uniref:Putative integral membrane protein (TIGR00698 family) n=1 Tax=Mucilaginibacter yixingensis TaxID=1295612 RepID=A0A2T5JGV0_9SPHI|nr:putative sulfate exporter family transporter [Mucilaginibacter yixingensis]PTR01624.1 putative integral membrane protein (TIGR00698 family) [Mucilaginibacter yixingensis]
MNAQSTTAPQHNDVLLNLSPAVRKALFLVCALLCLTPWIGPPEALLLGLAVALISGHPWQQVNHRATQWLLQLSVVGLGFGMNAQSAWKAGSEGLVFAAFSITGTLTLGYFVAKWLGIEKKAAHLIACGTAICGGSAIAAVSPVIKAEEKQTSVALGCVFILNSAALFIFPAIGHALHLNQTQFGLWCAIAIHDTSSVVGAAGKFGTQALQIATTVKLARALWIVPVALLSAFSFKVKTKKVHIPWFILLFIGAMLVNSYIPQFAPIDVCINLAAKAGLTLTLFLIGAGLSKQVLTSVGLKPFMLSVILWLAISTVTLYAVIHLL